MPTRFGRRLNEAAATERSARAYAFSANSGPLAAIKDRKLLMSLDPGGGVPEFHQLGPDDEVIKPAPGAPRSATVKAGR